MFGLVFSCLI